jgi:hypothetical protein
MDEKLWRKSAGTVAARILVAKHIPVAKSLEVSFFVAWKNNRLPATLVAMQALCHYM